MDIFLQQSGNVQDDNDDDDDDVNIEYISTTSTAQAICNICSFLGMCPINSASGIYLQKSDILENLKATWLNRACFQGMCSIIISKKVNH